MIIFLAETFSSVKVIFPKDETFEILIVFSPAPAFMVVLVVPVLTLIVSLSFPEIIVLFPLPSKLIVFVPFPALIVFV